MISSRESSLFFASIFFISAIFFDSSWLGTWSIGCFIVALLSFFPRIIDDVIKKPNPITLVFGRGHPYCWHQPHQSWVVIFTPSWSFQLSLSKPDLSLSGSHGPRRPRIMVVRPFRSWELVSTLPARRSSFRMSLLPMMKRSRMVSARQVFFWSVGACSAHISAGKKSLALKLNSVILGPRGLS